LQQINFNAVSLTVGSLPALPSFHQATEDSAFDEVTYFG